MMQPTDKVSQQPEANPEQEGRFTFKPVKEWTNTPEGVRQTSPVDTIESSEKKPTMTESAMRFFSLGASKILKIISPKNSKPHQPRSSLNEELSKMTEKEREEFDKQSQHARKESEELWDQYSISFDVDDPTPKQNPPPPIQEEPDKL
jgi:hypothetical protein